MAPGQDGAQAARSASCGRSAGLTCRNNRECRKRPPSLPNAVADVGRGLLLQAPRTLREAQLVGTMVGRIRPLAGESAILAAFQI
jgi:hypothetical protein